MNKLNLGKGEFEHDINVYQNFIVDMIRMVQEDTDGDNFVEIVPSEIDSRYSDMSYAFGFSIPTGATINVAENEDLISSNVYISVVDENHNIDFPNVVSVTTGAGTFSLSESETWQYTEEDSCDSITIENTHDQRVYLIAHRH